MQPALAPTPPELVWFRGTDAVKFLNDLISQEIGTLKPGKVTRSLLLEPRGHIDFILWVLRGDEEVGLVTEDGRGQELLDRLTRYRIRVEVEIEAETRPIGLVLGESTESGTWASSESEVRADLSWPTLTRELIVGTLPDIPRASEEEFARARIDAGEPLVGVDLDEKTIPQETGLVEGGISFDKGCFLGQELVARLDSRGGRVNRQLRVLRFDDPVATGSTLSSPDREVGTVSTSSGDAGLALVWREVEPGDVIMAGGVKTTVEDIPQKTAGSFTAS